MKAWLGLLVALVMIAPATAQVAAWTDPVGDHTVEYGVSGGEQGHTEPVPNEAGWYPNLDITRAGIYDETNDDIIFEFMVASEEPADTEIESPYEISYLLQFTYHEEPMRLNMYYYPQWADAPFVVLERLEGENWDFLMWTEADQHPDGEGWLIPVPKWDLRDSQLVPAREGDVIGDIWASAARSEWDYGGVAFTGICPNQDNPFSTFNPGCGFRPSDVAGSESAPLGQYTLTKSPEGLGHILLEVERPIRASNGLATTYVYEMTLFNLDDEPDSVSLTASNTPSGWDVYLPPRIELEGDEVKKVRMAIGVPFGHKHGEWAGLEIHAKSERDAASISSTQVIVFWPEIAQPSGHHERLYFHADGYRRWMNSVNEDPGSDGSGIVPAYIDGCSGFCLSGLADPEPRMYDYSYYWYTFLRPSLFTGLDFEIDQPIEGNLEVAIDANMEASVPMTLVLFREDMEPLVIGQQESIITFIAGETQSIPVSMTVDPAADRLPYLTNSALRFRFDIIPTSTEATDQDPNNVANQFFGFNNDMDYRGELYSSNSFLDLPLLDYHDEVDPGLLDALTRLQLEAPEEIARPVNPGKTAAYFFEVVNKGEVDDTVQWTIEGPKADWAQVVPDYSKVKSDGKATVAIRVDVPADATRQEVADLLLVGQSTKDPEAQVFGNFIAYVETEADIPDEAERFASLQEDAEEGEARGAPFPVVVALAAVAVATLARRRQE